VQVDPFDQRRYPNANIAVFGHSGAGKTYLLSSLAMGALGRGVQVYLIDPEHEYGKLAVELGGVDIQLALGSGHALNVLDLRPAGQQDAGAGSPRGAGDHFAVWVFPGRSGDGGGGGGRVPDVCAFCGLGRVQ